ncbi:MAG: hypothetical protein ACFFCW_47690, partial [Candidatus Hodarchaeota archaeon]
MHVAFFNPSFYPDVAATGQLLTEICEWLAGDYGFQVSVVAGQPYYPQNRDFKERFPIAQEKYNGVKILRTYSTTLSKRRAFYRFTNYISYFLFSLIGGLYLKKPDVIVSLTDPPIIGLVGLLWARIYRAKFVFWCQDIFPEVALLLEDFRNDDRLTRDIRIHENGVIVEIESQGERSDFRVRVTLIPCTFGPKLIKS